MPYLDIRRYARSSMCGFVKTAKPFTDFHEIRNSSRTVRDDFPENRSMSVMDYFRISARTFYILDTFSSPPYVPHAQPITSDYPNNIWLAVQITMLPNMQIPLVSCCHLQLTSNCLPQHLTLNSLSVSSFVNMTDKVSHSYKTGKVI
jgi:hypothetical protein